MSKAFLVPPPLAAPMTTVESSQSSTFSGTAVTPLVESAVEVIDDIIGVALMGPSSQATEEPRPDVSNV